MDKSKLEEYKRQLSDLESQMTDEFVNQLTQEEIK